MNVHYIYITYVRVTEVIAQRCSVKNVFSEISQNSQENSASACNFIKKETLAQVFFYEFWEISKNTFSYRTPPMAASRVTGLEFYGYFIIIVIIIIIIFIIIFIIIIIIIIIIVIIIVIIFIIIIIINTIIII